MITNEEYLSSLKAKIAQLAESMISGEISFLEGSIELHALGHESGLAEDSDFSIFTVIASETDHLPVGKVRQHWSQSALDRLAPELKESEEWAKNIAVGACESLVRRFAA